MPGGLAASRRNGLHDAQQRVRVADLAAVGQLARDREQARVRVAVLAHADRQAAVLVLGRADLLVRARLDRRQVAVGHGDGVGVAHEAREGHRGRLDDLVEPEQVRDHAGADGLGAAVGRAVEHAQQGAVVVGVEHQGAHRRVEPLLDRRRADARDPLEIHRRQRQGHLVLGVVAEVVAGDERQDVRQRRQGAGVGVGLGLALPPVRVVDGRLEVVDAELGQLALVDRDLAVGQVALGGLVVVARRVELVGGVGGDQGDPDLVADLLGLVREVQTEGEDGGQLAPDLRDHLVAVDLQTYVGVRGCHGLLFLWLRVMGSALGALLRVEAQQLGLVGRQVLVLGLAGGHGLVFRQLVDGDARRLRGRLRLRLVGDGPLHRGRRDRGQQLHGERLVRHVELLELRRVGELGAVGRGHRLGLGGERRLLEFRDARFERGRLFCGGLGGSQDVVRRGGLGQSERQGDFLRVHVLDPFGCGFGLARRRGGRGVGLVEHGPHADVGGVGQARHREAHGTAVGIERPDGREVAAPAVDHVGLPEVGQAQPAEESVGRIHLELLDPAVGGGIAGGVEGVVLGVDEHLAREGADDAVEGCLVADLLDGLAGDYGVELAERAELRPDLGLALDGLDGFVRHGFSFLPPRLPIPDSRFPIPDFSKLFILHDFKLKFKNYVEIFQKIYLICKNIYEIFSI